MYISQHKGYILNVFTRLIVPGNSLIFYFKKIFDPILNKDEMPCNEAQS